MTRSPLSFVLALAALGCGAADPPVQDRPVASASAAPSAPPTVASAAPSADAPSRPAPARVAVDVPATLARLPKDAAIYGWVRPAAGDILLDWSRWGGDIRRELERTSGVRTIHAILTQLGIDPEAPIAGAVVAPDLREAQKRLDAVVPAKDAAVAIARSAPNGTFVRLVARGLPGVDVVAQARAMATQLGMDVVTCPADALCVELGAVRPGFVGFDRKHALALFVEGDRVEIDIVMGEPDAPRRKLQLLAARHALPTGGPSARCATLDPEADLSTCVDADRAAELGAASGLLTVAGVLDTVDPKVRGKLAIAGKQESMRNVELSRPQKVLLEDGTLSVTLAHDGYRARASWRTTDASTKLVETRLAEEKCADVPREGPALLAALLEVFPDPGKDFASPKRIDHVSEAGFGGPLVLLGRSWPNLMKTLVSSGFTLGKAPPAKVCARGDAGRLRLDVTGQPLPL